MARELKFRAWDKQFHRMKPTGMGLNHGVLEGEDVEIMQYTGLHDKNGEEIWEGDIVSYPEYPDHISITGSKSLPAKVEFIDGMFCAGKRPLSYWLSPNNGIGIVSVIGNIYENPELMER